MKPIQMRVVVRTDNYDEAVRFFRDVLGSEQELQVHGDGNERVTILDVGRATLELAKLEGAEGGAVEREIAAVIGEACAGLGLRHPGAELDLADAGSGNPDRRRFRHGCSRTKLRGMKRLRCRIIIPDSAISKM